jgi:hypothetical protein
MLGFFAFAKPLRSIVEAHHRIALEYRFRYCVSERRFDGIIRPQNQQYVD